MGDLLQALVYGITIGSVYALVALGYSLIFSTTRIVNFAQGTLVVLGGYLAWWLYDQAFDGDIPLAAVTLLVMVLAAVAGLVVHAVTIAPLGRFDPSTNIGWLVTTFGAAIVIQELVAKGHQRRRPGAPRPRRFARRMAGQHRPRRTDRAE